MSKNSYDPIKNAREFYVDTPIGKLRIHSKHTGESDIMEDYPGVFIDLVGKDGCDVMLACVEWNSGYERIQTVAYANPNSDEPTDIIPYEEVSEGSSDGPYCAECELTIVDFNTTKEIRYASTAADIVSLKQQAIHDAYFRITHDLPFPVIDTAGINLAVTITNRNGEYVDSDEINGPYADVILSVFK